MLPDLSANVIVPSPFATNSTFVYASYVTATFSTPLTVIESTSPAAEYILYVYALGDTVYLYSLSEVVPSNVIDAVSVTSVGAVIAVDVFILPSAPKTAGFEDVHVIARPLCCEGKLMSYLTSFAFCFVIVSAMSLK